MDYAAPIQVNGFTCRNCTDVSYANRQIDPAHPKSGPYGVNADKDPSRTQDAVRFAGRLAGLDVGGSGGVDDSRIGTTVDIRA